MARRSPPRRGVFRPAIRRLMVLLAALTVTIGSVPHIGSVTHAARAQGVVRNTFGDWQLRCETPAGAASEQCALVQNIVAEDRPNITLLVIVLKTADRKSRLLRIVAPLGILLTGGLGVRVDNADVGRAGFIYCVTTGCVAEVNLEDNFINQLKSGKQATFVVFQTPEEGIGIPVSLNGFGPGFDALP